MVLDLPTHPVARLFVWHSLWPDPGVFQCLSDSKFGPFLHGVFGNGRVEGWVDAAPLTPEQMGQSSPTNFPKLIAQGLGSMHNLDMPGAKAPMLWTVSRSLIDGNAPIVVCVMERPTTNTVLPTPPTVLRQVVQNGV